ncbi:MAG: hypothetical protein D6753_13570 [Planctomycetota bacterium]|nr:MAG: hypothetical protein D6753_13570 [Planctomycetota bacterium]
MLAVCLVGASATCAVGQEPTAVPPPLPLVASESMSQVQPLTFTQQLARMEAEQRAMRIQWYNWIGYSRLRPTVNATHLSTTLPRYYIPSRGVIVKYAGGSAWYW